MFTNKKRAGINKFVCAVSLYVVETSKASIKDHEPPLTITPFGIVAYGFVGQPFSKQLYTIFTGEWYSVFHWVSKHMHVMWHTCRDLKLTL